MDKAYESKYHEFEENYWWFVARRYMIVELLGNLKKNPKILDIGCSGGHLIKLLKQNGLKNVYGIDISKKAIELCKEKGIKNVFVMNAVKTDFEKEEFEVIIASDILEHIKNNKMALVEWNNLLKPGGNLIIFVPAFNLLWSEHDELNHHYRRYTKSELIRNLKKSNFKVIRSSYWNFSLFFPMVLFKIFKNVFLKNKDQKRDHLYILNPSINKLLLCLLKFENLVLRHFNFPLGTSVFVLATKIK